MKNMKNAPLPDDQVSTEVRERPVKKARKGSDSPRQEKARQISARLNPLLQEAFRKRLELEGITQQEFIDSVVVEYVAGRLKMKKSLDLELRPGDELYLELLAGNGYEADSIDDLMDQLQGHKPLRRIKCR
jgi:predicted DNA binding CopG/RHH family protein